MVQRHRNWQIRPALGWLLITNIVIFYLGLCGLLGQECLKQPDEEMLAGCVGRGSCKLGGELQRIDSRDFLQPSFAKRKQKILSFTFKVSSLR